MIHLHERSKDVTKLSAYCSSEFSDAALSFARIMAGSNQRQTHAPVTLLREPKSGLAEFWRGTPYLLRPPQVGDMGWIVHRQAILYAQEYGWDELYEGLAAEIVAKFIKEYDPKRERCWIAEKDGATVGSVFAVKGSDEVAKLRLLYIEPSARGLGIGKRLVEECVRFARQAGYRKMTLWTAKHSFCRAPHL